MRSFAVGLEESRNQMPLMRYLIIKTVFIMTRMMMMMMMMILLLMMTLVDDEVLVLVGPGLKLQLYHPQALC